ncbi:MAG: serine hydrolase domain-containing protein, partial [Actinomycetes bacterium]
MGRRSKFIVAAIVIGALSLGLTACSSKDGGSSSATTTSSPASSSAKWKGAARSTTPMSATDKAAIDTIANEALKQLPGLPGLWVGVWDPKKGVYVTAYGSAVDPDQKATTEDHSRIGSVTKTFTATAVLQQVEAGKLSLDDTIGDVLPDLAAEHPAVGKITVQQLLGMTSGIPDYANTGLVLNKVVQDPTKVWTPEEIIDLTLTESKLSAPGTPGYSTTNYLILGQMVEKVSGISIEQAIGKVAKAAGLKNSALTEPSDNALPAPSSHGYLNEP